jgi:hypothetical protein
MPDLRAQLYSFMGVLEHSTERWWKLLRAAKGLAPDTISVEQAAKGWQGLTLSNIQRHTSVVINLLESVL